MSPAPFPFQVDGAIWLTSHRRVALLDDMGLGKSRQAVMAMDWLHLTRGVIICKASLRQMWINELKKWSVIKRRYIKATKTSHFVSWQEGKYDVLVVSYELAAKWTPLFWARMEVFDFCIFDEFQMVKNPSSKRTKALLGGQCDGLGALAQWSLRTWILTGTIIPNDIIDVWPMLKFTGAVKGPREGFAKEFLKERQTLYGCSYSVLPGKQEKLKALIASVSLRRTQKSVGLQIPPLFITNLILDGDTSKVSAFFREHPGLDSRIQDALERGGLAFIDQGHLMTIRRLIGEAKAVPFASHLVSLLLSGELDKCVVMGVHVRALKHLEAELKMAGLDVVKIIGETGENERVRAVRRFQEDANCRVFIGNMHSAGTGHTLVAASTLFVLESAWTPADNAQAIKRIHRIGQSRNCRVYFVTLADSQDEWINEIVFKKTMAIASIEGDAMLCTPNLTSEVERI